MSRAAVMVALAFALLSLAVRPAAGQAPAGGGPEALALEQSRAQQRMAEVEQRLLELARMLEAEQPARADQLRRALALSRESFIVSKMETVRDLLGEERYAEAVPIEQDVLADLERLVASLSAEQWADELAGFRTAEKRLGDLLERESAAAVRTGELARAAGPRDAQASEADLAAAGEQREIRAEAEGLQADLRGGPGATELGAALRSMSAAEEALAAALREDATKAQEDAVSGLRAALDAVRQAIQKVEARRRAEMRQRLIGVLERMLASQQAVRTETARWDAAVAGGSPTRAARLALADLAVRQEALGPLAQEALSLSEEEAMALALPVALEQVKADIATSAALLRAGTTGPAVQTVQEETEAELRAMIAALRPEEGAGAAPPTPTRRGPPSSSAARDVALELKVLRGLQASLQRRTASLDRMRGPGGKLPAGLGQQAAQLAERQGRITAAFDGLGNVLKEAGAE